MPFYDHGENISRLGELRKPNQDDVPRLLTDLVTEIRGLRADLAKRERNSDKAKTARRR